MKVTIHLPFTIITMIVFGNAQAQIASTQKVLQNERPFRSSKAHSQPFPLNVEASRDSVFIDFVGTGDIQKSVSNGDNINANTGLGAIFERYYLDKSDPGRTDFKNSNFFQSLEVEGLINIASTADSLVAEPDSSNRRTFGAYVLNPISAKQSAFINTTLYFGQPDIRIVKNFLAVVNGLHARVIASNSVWADDNGNSSNLGAMLIRIGVFHEVLPDNLRLTKQRRNKYSLSIGINRSYRWIFGDIRSREVLRNDVLGSKETNFKGWEANFGFRLNNLRAEFMMPILWGPEKKSIDGLTNTQFLFSIKFVGGFGLKIEK